MDDQQPVTTERLDWLGLLDLARHGLFTILRWLRDTPLVLRGFPADRRPAC
jgi:hypothetical protein